MAKQFDAFTATDTLSLDGAAKQRLRKDVERIEALEQERRDLADDVKAIVAALKADSFDIVALREVLALRKAEVDDPSDERAIVDLYWNALKGSADD